MFQSLLFFVFVVVAILGAFALNTSLLRPKVNPSRGQLLTEASKDVSIVGSSSVQTTEKFAVSKDQGLTSIDKKVDLVLDQSSGGQKALPARPSGRSGADAVYSQGIADSLQSQQQLLDANAQAFKESKRLLQIAQDSKQQVTLAQEDARDKIHRSKDSMEQNALKVTDVKQKTEDQKQMLKDKMADQMQMLRDRMNR